MGRAATQAVAGGVSAGHTAQEIGKIGPNAVLQVFDVLDAALGPEETSQIARRAGLSHHRERPPSAMIDERDVITLHQTVRADLPTDQADEILTSAGEQTARYILANRIPKPAQLLLRLMPARLASQVLLRAIAKHAWTFAGSGMFAFQAGKPTIMTLTDCSACTQVYRINEPCRYYTATFAGLFQALVHPEAQVTDTLSASTDGQTRQFVLDWPS